MLTTSFGAQQAEDARHEVLIRFSRYESVPHPKALLKRIARNLAINAGLKADGHDLCIRQLGTVTVTVEPCQATAVLLRQIVLGLPEPIRDVFVMSRFEGLTNAEIAERLGISVKTVEARMTKALAHCAAELRP